MWLLRDGAAVERKLPPARGGGVHQPVAAAQSFGLRGIAAGLWRAPDERGGRAPTGSTHLNACLTRIILRS